MKVAITIDSNTDDHVKNYLTAQQKLSQQSSEVNHD